jgi:hypothetical protein
MNRHLELKHRLAFAYEFKTARAGALRNAEAFEEHLFVMERLGSYLTRSHRDLGKYQVDLRGLADESPLAHETAVKYPEFHVGFDALYDEVRVGRNDAMHEGAVARHLARHAQELALIMEDALMNAAKTAKEFMVRGPACAEHWHPLSAIRRTMLTNAFSFLPYLTVRGDWRLVSDSRLVQFLRDSSGSRKDRLLMTLEEALAEGLRDIKPILCGLDEPVTKLASRMKDIPCLVVSEDKRLLGILTAFDLL